MASLKVRDPRVDIFVVASECMTVLKVSLILVKMKINIVTLTCCVQRSRREEMCIEDSSVGEGEMKVDDSRESCIKVL